MRVLMNPWLCFYQTKLNSTLFLLTLIPISCGQNHMNVVQLLLCGCGFTSHGRGNNIFKSQSSSRFRKHNVSNLTYGESLILPKTNCFFPKAKTNLGFTKQTWYLIINWNLVKDDYQWFWYISEFIALKINIGSNDSITNENENFLLL